MGGKRNKENEDSKNYFLISVAKGMEITLTKDFKASVTTKISGDTPYVSLGAEAKVEASYKKTKKFSGPPENSKYNSREYI